jgi:hypothetical protein
MLSLRKYNLNEVSHDTAIWLIRRALEKGIKLVEVREWEGEWESELDRVSQSQE